MRKTAGKVITLSPNHWTLRHYKERMTSGEWKKCLLAGNDRIMYAGHLVSMRVVRLGYGVVEVSKDIPNEADGEGNTCQKSK